jgi:hypothetical protein
MPNNKLSDPLSPLTEYSRLSVEWGAKIFLVFDFVFLCIVEAHVIRGLWFRHGATTDTLDKFEIPIFVLLPSLMALAALITIRKLAKAGEVKPSVPARIQYVISIMLLMVYLAMLQLAKIAFH